MQNNTTKLLQRVLKAREVLSTRYFRDIVRSWISLLRPDLILALCLPDPGRSQHPQGRTALGFLSRDPQEVLFGRWQVGGDGADGPCHFQAHMVCLSQRNCMVACVSDGHTALVPVGGSAAINADPVKWRGHLALCLWPSWTWAVT